MEIKFNADLSKFIDLARKKGVRSFKITNDSIEMELREEAPPSNYKKKQSDVSRETPETNSPYTDEDVLFWSSDGIPEQKEVN